MQSVRLLQRGSVYCRPLQHHLTLPTRVVQKRQQLRCLASSRDKSWGEILSSAADLGRDVASKVGESLKNVVTSIVPAKDEETLEEQRRERERRQLEQEKRKSIQESLEYRFGGGIAGRILGRMVAGTITETLKGLEEQQEAMLEVIRKAEFEIQSSSEVRQALGTPVEVEDIHSSTINGILIDGRLQELVQVHMTVAGPRGVGDVQVEQDKNGELKIVIGMSGGRQVHLGGDRGSGRIIDVDYTEIK